MRRTFLGLMLSLMTTWVSAHESANVITKPSLTVSGDKFLLNGEPFVVRSGEMHYARVPLEYWRDRLQKMKAMGLNTISTYVFWNLHEAQPGEFDFSGSLDLAQFIKTAHKEGLWVILRPSPYICAEWEFGGFPSWLLKSPAMKVRSSDPRFLAASDRFLKKVGEQVKPLLLENGGPIIMIQLENEYGSFGKDREYLPSLYNSYQAAGLTGFLYTADSVWDRPDVQSELAAGTLPYLHATVNFGQTSDPGKAFYHLQKFRPGSALMSGEYWVGWFDHPGEAHSTKDPVEAAEGLEWMLNRDIGFNIYMFHGGTSFGFMNGANWTDKGYAPDPTSYDYDAPLDEAGRPTHKYETFRNLLQQYLQPGEVLPDVPQSTHLINIPKFRFEETAPLSDLLRDQILSEKTLTMEDVDQDYGFILYRHRPQAETKGTLEIRELHDYSLISQGEKRLGILDRRKKKQSLKVSLKAEIPLDILIENMGRINFSPKLVEERKGITEGVYLNGKEIRNWEIFRLPMKDLSALQFGKTKIRGPRFYKAEFNLEETGDTFLDLSLFGKGVVFVNGRNLGRYWEIGPQKTLYCPASWLNKGKNNILVLDLFDEKNESLTMQGLTDPIQ